MVKQTQNQYFGTEKELPRILNPGSLYVAVDTKSVFLADKNGFLVKFSGENSIYSNFDSLSDTPDSKAGNFGKYVRVSDDGLSLEYVDVVVPTDGIGISQQALNYSSFTPGNEVGLLAYAEESEGTKWLPGTVGGSYYPQGFYIWDGSSWKSDRNAIAQQFQTLIVQMESKVDDSDQDGILRGRIDGTWAEIENNGGGGATLTEEIIQLNHGFSVGDCIYFDGTNYIKGNADSLNTSSVIGIVKSVNDASNFIYQYGGIMTEGTWVSGKDYFLSNDTDGLVSEEPNYLFGEVRVYVGKGVETGLLINIDIGQEIVEESSQDISGIAVNSANISENTDAIALNTAKVGITPTQASNIISNNAKISYTDASSVAANTAKNSYPNGDALKLSGIESGAQVNVKADWNATSGDAQILNKPVISDSFSGDYNDLTNKPTTITVGQANEIAANTLKVSYDDAAAVTLNTAKVGITSQQASDITSNNNKISYTDAAAVSANTLKNSYPSADATKLGNIENNAQVNVQSDWNATSGDALILNKPTIPVVFSGDYNDLSNKPVTITGTSLEIGDGTIANTKVNGSLALGTDTAFQKLHIVDGNALLQAGGEVAIIMKRDVTFTNSHPNSPFVNPIFQIGRIIEGGDGAPQFRWMYSDDNVGETVVMELDSEGIMSSVRQERGSHFEAHIEGEANPFFRLNSSPDMRLEMGPGGNLTTDVAVCRSDVETLSFCVGSGASEEKIVSIKSTGAEYSQDYSSNYTDRTLVDKGYVDSLSIGGGSNQVSADADNIAIIGSDGFIYVPPGVPNSASASLNYLFTSTGDPENTLTNTFQVDNSNLNLVTKLYLSESSYANVQVGNIIELIKSGDAVYIQQDNDDSKFLNANIIGPAVLNGTTYEIPVQVVAAGNSFTLNSITSAIIYHGNNSAGNPVSSYGLLAARYKSAASTNVTSATNITIPFATQIFQDTGFVNTSITKKTVTQKARYRINTSISITGTQGNYRYTCELSIRKNGNEIIQSVKGGYIRSSTGSNDTYVTIDSMFELEANDEIEVLIKRINTVAGNATIVPEMTYLEITKMN